MFHVKQTTFAQDPDEGVTVEYLGRYYISYRIGPQLLILPREAGGTDTYVEIIWFPKNLSWAEPYGDKKITDEEREKIKFHLSEAVMALVPNSQVKFVESLESND